MEAIVSLNAQREARELFEQHLDNYVYGVAKSQNSELLHYLFAQMPEMLTHIARRPISGESFNWQLLSVPWAIFADQAEYGDSSRKCLRMLKNVGFVPDGHFLDRLSRNGQIDLLLDFCDVFAVDTSALTTDDGFSLLTYGVGNISLADGLERFTELLNRAADVNAPTGFKNAPVLFELFTNNIGENPEKESKCLAAIDLMLDKQASTEISGMVRGWIYGIDEFEIVPLLHAVYFSELAGRISSAIVNKAESVCNTAIRDAKGRTAQEYRQHLIELGLNKCKPGVAEHLSNEAAL
jgi:hypothetical protein